MAEATFSLTSLPMDTLNGPESLESGVLFFHGGGKRSGGHLEESFAIGALRFGMAKDKIVFL
jgi:hypothetical protein